jgi:hypothetical protein
MYQSPNQENDLSHFDCLSAPQAITPQTRILCLISTELSKLGCNPDYSLLLVDNENLNGTSIAQNELLELCNACFKVINELVSPVDKQRCSEDFIQSSAFLNKAINIYLENGGRNAIATEFFDLKDNIIAKFKNEFNEENFREAEELFKIITNSTISFKQSDKLLYYLHSSYSVYKLFDAEGLKFSKNFACQLLITQFKDAHSTNLFSMGQFFAEQISQRDEIIKLLENAKKDKDQFNQSLSTILVKLEELIVSSDLRNSSSFISIDGYDNIVNQSDNGFIKNFSINTKIEVNSFREVNLYNQHKYEVLIKGLNTDDLLDCLWCEYKHPELFQNEILKLTARSVNFSEECIKSIIQNDEFLKSTQDLIFVVESIRAKFEDRKEAINSSELELLLICKVTLTNLDEATYPQTNKFLSSLLTDTELFANFAPTDRLKNLIESNITTIVNHRLFTDKLKIIEILGSNGYEIITNNFEAYCKNVSLYLKSERNPDVSKLVETNLLSLFEAGEITTEHLKIVFDKQQKLFPQLIAALECCEKNDKNREKVIFSTQRIKEYFLDKLNSSEQYLDKDEIFTACQQYLQNIRALTWQDILICYQKGTITAESSVNYLVRNNLVDKAIKKIWRILR